MIIKTRINENTKSLDYLHIILQNYIKKRKTKFIGNISLDYRNNIRVDNELIPFLLYNFIIFKYNSTFQQNNKLISNNIRRCVIQYINRFDKTKGITCIGGESFIYPIITNFKDRYNFYSDSDKLVKEAYYNFDLYNPKKIYSYPNDIFKAETIDYNLCDNIYCYKYLVLNLDKLNKNLMKIINNKKYLSKIIIINCCQKDFWKKIKLLTNFKIKKRDKFISSNYFVTVTLLSRNI